MAKKKLKALRPGDAPAATAAAPLAVATPVAAGGAENLAGVELTQIGRELAGLMNERDKLQKQIELLDTKIDIREARLAEQMPAQKTQRFTVEGRTFYQIHQTIVSRAAGVSPGQLVNELQAWGLGDIVKTDVNSKTLGATVKNLIDNAAANGMIGKKTYCQQCQEFFDPAKLPAGEKCPECCGQFIPEEQPRLINVVDGIPAALHELLYVEPRIKIGCQRV